MEDKMSRTMERRKMRRIRMIVMPLEGFFVKRKPGSKPIGLVKQQQERQRSMKFGETSGVGGGDDAFVVDIQGWGDDDDDSSSSSANGSKHEPHDATLDEDDTSDDDSDDDFFQSMHKHAPTKDQAEVTQLAPHKTASEDTFKNSTMRPSARKHVMPMIQRNEMDGQTGRDTQSIVDTMNSMTLNDDDDHHHHVDEEEEEEEEESDESDSGGFTIKRKSTTPVRPSTITKPMVVDVDQDLEETDEDSEDDSGGFIVRRSGSTMVGKAMGNAGGRGAIRPTGLAQQKPPGVNRMGSFKVQTQSKPSPVGVGVASPTLSQGERKLIDSILAGFKREGSVKINKEELDDMMNGIQTTQNNGNAADPTGPPKKPEMTMTITKDKLEELLVHWKHATSMEVMREQEKKAAMMFQNNRPPRGAAGLATTFTKDDITNFKQSQAQQAIYERQGSARTAMNPNAFRTQQSMMNMRNNEPVAMTSRAATVSGPKRQGSNGGLQRDHVSMLGHSNTTRGHQGRMQDLPVDARDADQVLLQESVAGDEVSQEEYRQAMKTGGQAAQDTLRKGNIYLALRKLKKNKAYEKILRPFWVNFFVFFTLLLFLPVTILFVNYITEMKVLSYFFVWLLPTKWTWLVNYKKKSALTVLVWILLLIPLMSMALAMPFVPLWEPKAYDPSIHFAEVVTPLYMHFFLCVCVAWVCAGIFATDLSEDKTVLDSLKTKKQLEDVIPLPIDVSAEELEKAKKEDEQLGSITAGYVLSRISDNVREAYQDRTDRLWNRRLLWVFLFSLGRLVTPGVFRLLSKKQFVLTNTTYNTLATVVMPVPAMGYLYLMFYLLACTVYNFWKYYYRMSVFTTLHSKRQSRKIGLPFLDLKKSSNIVAWSKLRVYFQWLDLWRFRWMELFVGLVLIAESGSLFVIFLTLFQPNTQFNIHITLAIYEVTVLGL
eukprot:TRINITY_DN971_c1_g1_i8.p1 TRINITY_DN971_c1_g1~~TRINITY_DN971_c1_g1_i8.p1  ORF type:complete len:938 (-),score=308.47 TRINITY_DN971_c1_g1_i8:435-3248(-)